MEETPIPSEPALEPDFFVEWQLADDPDRLIDLSTAETEGLRTDPASLPAKVRGTVATRR